MKISSREDIEVPIGFVFQQVCDFPRFEQQAIARGADVRPVGQGNYQVGSHWDVTFRYRGRKRKLRAEIQEIDVPERLRLQTESSGISGETVVDLVALSPNLTRMIASIELRPKTMPARILIQSLKLAKISLTNRFKRRLGDFGQDVTDAYKRSA